MYGDDQCEECGGIRAAGAVICVNCLVRTVTKLENEVTEKRGKIEGLEKKIELLKGMLDDTVWYGFKQNRKVVDMARQIDELTQEIEGE